MDLNDRDVNEKGAIVSICDEAGETVDDLRVPIEGEEKAECVACAAPPLRCCALSSRLCASGCAAPSTHASSLALPLPPPRRYLPLVEAIQANMAGSGKDVYVTVLEGCGQRKILAQFLLK